MMYHFLVSEEFAPHYYNQPTIQQVFTEKIFMDAKQNEISNKISENQQYSLVAALHSAHTLYEMCDLISSNDDVCALMQWPLNTENKILGHFRGFSRFSDIDTSYLNFHIYSLKIYNSKHSENNILE